jgi:hypothetical protein
MGSFKINCAPEAPGARVDPGPGIPAWHYFFRASFAPPMAFWIWPSTLPLLPSAASLASAIYAWEIPCTQAGDIGAPSAGNADFVVIQTHLPWFLIEHKKNRALRVGAAAGGGRSSAISRRMSANKRREMAAGNTNLHGARTEGGNHAE